MVHFSLCGFTEANPVEVHPLYYNCLMVVLKKLFLNTFLPFEIQMFGLKFPFAPFSKSILEGACGCCIDAFAIQYLNLSLNETQMV